jgi:4-hydroxy-2-oxoheptanedioate aldolase
MTKRLNPLIDLLKQNQPVYYVSTSDLTYENGKNMASTWADYIRVDLQHSPLNIEGVQQFIQGLKEAHPSNAPYPIVPVIAELPCDGTDEATIRANSWQIRQLLACGVFGLLLCHAETEGAVRAFVEQSRFAFQTIGRDQGIGIGRRGVGGHEVAAKVWGIELNDYMHKADPWPLNPDGELILGIKMENARALENCEASARVPGICFGEWGLADMSNNFGYPIKPGYPLPEDLQPVKERVWNACKNAGIYFLGIIEKDTYKEILDEGQMFCRAYDPEVAKLARAYSKKKS